MTQSAPFSIPLFVDQIGFLLKFGVGNPNHQYHARAEVNRVCKVRAALLSEEQQKELKDAELFARHGILLSREQICYFARKASVNESDDIDEILQYCIFLYENKPSPTAYTAETQEKPSGFISEVRSHDDERGENTEAYVDMNLMEKEANDMA